MPKRKKFLDFRQISVDADSKTEALRKAQRFRYSDGSITSNAVPVKAVPSKTRKGKFFVTVRRDKRNL